MTTRNKWEIWSKSSAIATRARFLRPTLFFMLFYLPPCRTVTNLSPLQDGFVLENIHQTETTDIYIYIVYRVYNIY